MRQGNKIRTAASHSGESPLRGVIIATVAVVCAFLYLIGVITGAFDSLRHAIQPYVPDWLALLILLLSPVTYALASLRSTGLGAGLALAIVFCCQAAIMGLAANQHPLIAGTVTLFIYLEAFIIIPERNKRLSGESPYISLDLKPRPTLLERKDPLNSPKI